MKNLKHALLLRNDENNLYNTTPTPPPGDGSVTLRLNSQTGSESKITPRVDSQTKDRESQTPVAAINGNVTPLLTRSLSERGIFANNAQPNHMHRSQTMQAMQHNAARMDIDSGADADEKPAASMPPAIAADGNAVTMVEPQPLRRYLPGNVGARANSKTKKPTVKHKLSDVNVLPETHDQEPPAKKSC